MSAEVPRMSPEVKIAFEQLPLESQPVLRALRSVIYDVAQGEPRIGEIEESLKWGDPAYRSVRPQTGTTLRLGARKDGRFGLFVPCSTSLIEQFKEDIPGLYDIDGTRGVILTAQSDPFAEPLRLLIHRALTYRLR